MQDPILASELLFLESYRYVCPIRSFQLQQISHHAQPTAAPSEMLNQFCFYHNDRGHCSALFQDQTRSAKGSSSNPLHDDKLLPFLKFPPDYAWRQIVN